MAATLQQTVDQLVSRARARTLGTIKPADPIPAMTKSAAAPATADSAPGGSGGGLASPLTETASTRTYYAETVIPTTDGLFAVRLQRVHAVTMTDANDDPAVFNYANE